MSLTSTAEIEQRRAAQSDDDILLERRCDCAAIGVPVGGYCGECINCFRPGHTSQYPGPLAVVATWCDRCYVEEARTLRLFRRAVASWDREAG